MTLNDAIHYQDGQLYVDDVRLSDLVSKEATPLYVYSEKRFLQNYEAIRAAFAHLDAHIHYSAKANANLSILRSLIHAGAGIDCVSAGEIFCALQAGAEPHDIVFAGVGKQHDEIAFALEQGIGWFNVENELELAYIQEIAEQKQLASVKITLRLNPDVTANTHPNIATGHGAAKFGLTADAVQRILAKQDDYPLLNFAGIHIHIGSQLHDTQPTVTAIEKALELMTPYPQLCTLNIGGGIPARYHEDEALPSAADFAQAISPSVQSTQILLEPGRSIIADAGILLTRVLYIKEQGGQRFVIVDAGMTELMRPALYQAKHDIVPLQQPSAGLSPAQVVGPVCETTDILGRDVHLPDVKPGDVLAILTVGAYGMVMANTYNARPRPAEIMITGDAWRMIRKPELWDDILRGQLLEN